MIFVGALVKLLGNGRIAAHGGRARRLSACALRTDDSATGHGRPRRELASLGPTGRPWCARSRLGIRRAFGLRTLVVVGLVMTAVIGSRRRHPSPSPLSAYHAGAIRVDQDCALIIGQKIGTATSSAMAAPAKRKGKILAKRNRPGRHSHNILAPPPAPSSGAKAQAVAIPFIVLPLPPRRAAVAGSRAYRKWRGAAPLRGR